jgi:Twin arginine targeting (Tat) protein translocase TatC
MSDQQSRASNATEVEQPFVSHLIELRDRILRAVLVVLAVFLALFYFANDIYALLAEPLLSHLPAGGSMIATDVASPFLTPLKLTLVTAIFVAIPYLLYQMWAFIAPGLYAHERRLIVPLLLSSTLLFYAGMAFAYFVVFPLVFGFFTAAAPEGVAVMTDINKYLDFVLTLFFAFGVAFEVPIATILLVWMGVVTPAALIAKRPYIIVGAFVIGMLLTPPDIFSQTLLAVPMWILFEIGVFFSRFYVREVSAEDDLNSEEKMDETLDRYIHDEEALRQELEVWQGNSSDETDKGDKPKE